MLKQLEVFVGCGDEWVEEKVMMLANIHDLYQANEISLDELEELVRDVTATDEILEEAGNIELRNDLLKVANALSSLV